jgi:hypothetical protein
MAALKVGAVGAQVTTAGTSATTAIPNDASGSRARWVRLSALASCYVRPGFVGTTATTGDMLLISADSVCLDVRPYTHIAHIQETAAAKFNITPLDSEP